jgi:serine protease Do
MSTLAARVLAAGAAALTLTLVGAGPALAATPTPAPTPSATASPQQATPTERAAAEVRPAIVYVTETFSAYVADETGTYFNNGNPYELTATCTGFGVNPDGYVATAGHCLDTYSPNGIKGDFIAQVAKEVVAAVPGVTLQEAVEFGTANWTVEGKAKGSAIDTQIAVVTGSVQGGGKRQVLPARLVDIRPFTQGDVALLKVETTDLPTVELAGDADVQIGTPLLSIGYPASADAVTDPSLEPSNKDGQVSAKKTVGSVPVYETSAALTPGMSGGPTVDLEGRVLGINSFMPAGESQAFNFVAPASGLTELLSRNGVRNELGPDDKAFRAALDAYYAGHYTDAIAGFDKLLQVAPQHAQAVQYRTLAAKARDRFGDVPVAAPPADPASPALFWVVVGGGAALAAGLAVLLVVLVRRRRRTPAATLPAGLPPTPFPGYGPIPAQAQPPRAEKVLVQPRCGPASRRPTARSTSAR